MTPGDGLLDVQYLWGEFMRIEAANENSYQRLASMRRVNSAADDAAGLAISQKINAQTNGYNTGADNALSMNDLARTAEGALASIDDNLHRMRELAVQASNGTLSSDDRKIIQTEIDQLKESISGIAGNTQFNTQKLLDGSFSNKEIAVNPSGTGTKMTIQNTSLETLGVNNFDVTGSFDIADIDNAISKVTEARSELGATSNRIMSAVKINWNAAENLTAASSRISDLDAGAESIRMNTRQVLQQYQYYSKQQTMNQKASALNLLT